MPINMQIEYPKLQNENQKLRQENEALKSALENVESVIERLINRTATGWERNELCDLNIKVKTILNQ